MTSRHHLLLPLLLALALAPLPRVSADTDEPHGEPSILKKIKYRSIGPAAGGRVSRACGVPGDPLVYYAATASGGVWKSSDGGSVWKPIFDDQPVSSIGCIAVAPSDANVIYVGSGEANIRGNVAAGNGIYKSTDAGKTWQHVWKQEGQISQIIVHPTKADLAYAAVLGRAFGPNPQRGVYRTSDGGRTWDLVLSKDADTGAVDVCFDLANPRVLFAALWQARRRPWEMTSGGPGSGLYRSDDAGATWKRLKDKGLPAGEWGRVGLAVAPSDGRRVYALIEADKGGLYRSDDGGKHWELATADKSIRQRPWYFSTITVHPHNADVVWASNVRLWKSIDAGKTFKQVKGPHHGDHHDIWIDPKDGRRIIDSNDGGVDLSIDNGETWRAPMLPLSQFYHVNVDTRTPYHVYGTMQDIGTAAGPSNSLSSSGIALAEWYGVGGGETGFAVPVPGDPNVVYAGEYGGYISRFDYRTRQAENVSIFPYNASGHAPEVLKYRFQWTAPILVSTHDPKVVYHGANVLFRTKNAGKSWEQISQDLTRNDRTKQKWSGGPITGDNTGAEVYDTLFAIAESPKKEGLLWVGSDDGLVHVTRDAGKTWTNVTKHIPGLPEWGTVVCIEPSPFDERTAYVVVDCHRLDNTKPYLFKTSDLGETWKSLTADLPQDVYLHAVREDPKQKGTLYVGTETGVSFSVNDGKSWQRLKLNLPPVAVHDLQVKDNDLVVGTHGRSVWILDELTPVRTYGAHLKEGAFLFPVQPAFRWRYHSAIYSTEDKTTGSNPPIGALVHYYLKDKAKGVVLEVLDGDGKVIRKLSSKKKDEKADDDEDDDGGEEGAPAGKRTVLPKGSGVHRIVWDLRYEGAATIKKAKIDTGDIKRGPIALPGTYTLKLKTAGSTLTTKLEILPDPRVQVPRRELEDQLKLALKLRDDVNVLVDTVHRLQSLKQQLVRRNELLAPIAKAKPLIKESKALIAKLDALEAKQHNPKAEVGYDILAQKGGARLYSQLAFLYSTILDADGVPSQGVRQQYAELHRELQDLEGEWDNLIGSEVPRLNELARTLEVPGVLVPGPGPRP